MNVHRIPVRGSFQTAGNTPTRAIVIPLLPMDGAFSVSGTILAVDDATPRSSVEFYPRFGGNVVAGNATENDNAGPATQPQDGGTAQAWAPAGLKTSIKGRQLEIILTGIDGKTIAWAWALEVVTIALGSSAPVANPSGPGP